LGAQFNDYWRQLKDFFVFKYLSTPASIESGCGSVINPTLNMTVCFRLSKKDLDAMVTNLCGDKVICALFLQLLLLSIHTYAFPFSALSAQQLGPRHHVCPRCVPLATLFKLLYVLSLFFTRDFL
jgi:hypothetical protein